MRFQKALNFRLRIKAAHCVAFKCFPDDGRIAFVFNQNHTAVFLALNILVTDRLFKHRVTAFQSGLHLLACLPRHLLSLKLSACCRVGLVITPFRRVVKIKVWRSDYSAQLIQLPAQRPIEFSITREPQEVVEDEKILGVPVRLDIFQRVHQFRPLGIHSFCTFYFVEHMFYMPAILGAVAAQPILLATQAIAFPVLLLVGYAAIQ